MHPPHRNGMKWSLLGPFHFSVASIPFKSEKSFVSFHSAPRSPLEEAEDRLGQSAASRWARGRRIRFPINGLCDATHTAVRWIKEVALFPLPSLASLIATVNALSRCQFDEL